jgi:hypothetical protein
MNTITLACIAISRGVFAAVVCLVVSQIITRI